jgi:hypothetical protein
MCEFLNWLVEDHLECIDPEIHGIPMRISSKTVGPFKKSVSWDKYLDVFVTFSSEDYDRSIDRFQIKKNIFLMTILRSNNLKMV